MNVKEIYQAAELEVIRFESIDIIRTSSDGMLDDDELPPVIVP